MILAATGSLFMTASCTQFTNTIRDTFNPQEGPAADAEGTFIPKRPRRTKDFLKDAGRLGAAQQALRALPAFAGKTIYLCQHAHFYDDGRIMARLQHPENPEYVDEYDYEGGKWAGPKPVQLSVRDNITLHRVPLDSVQFAAIATIYRNYTQKADSVQGTMPFTHAYIIIRNGNFEWYPQTISGSREIYHISFRHNGSIDLFYRK
ncbi:hypothetical protein DLD77_05040 [Chitinophaga alhagiae]|uniref:Uncharacterized protein n=1 Tax=Chitinophaga alhagiae TaxID=2203219 RepID=A0ABM6WAX3_9BACT|nr:hypothetical protein DLD77_05040 [Chitinophaga alhagiae]